MNWRKILLSQVPWPRPARMALFSVLAIALLVVGALASYVAWIFNSPRYATPGAGYYSASVLGNLIYDAEKTSDFEDVSTSFYFRGKCPARWFCLYSTNFPYTRLEINWTRIGPGNDTMKGKGELTLPSMQYGTSAGTGVLTRAVLAEWLVGTTNPPRSVMTNVERIFDYLDAAGQGTLPTTRHHPYRPVLPLRGSVAHFKNGVGVPAVVFIWVGAWLCLVAWYGQRVWRVHTS